MTVEVGTRALAPTRAAQELELRRDEFQLAVQLGLVRTVPGPEPGAPRGPGAARAPGGRRRVEQAEIDRLRAAPDFPDGLRDRVRTVGTTEAAALLSVTPDRFTKLARTGHFSPVRFYLNRYRAVVWLYLAGELGEFALTRPAMLTGRLPKEIRERADGGEDRRPRNWRARRLGLLLRATEDPWARAAAIASLLDPAQLAEVVEDPCERTHLDRLRPEPPSARPESAAAREIADRLALADDPDEILWHRMSLALALDEARADRAAPRPDGGIVLTGAGPSWPGEGVGVTGAGPSHPDGAVDVTGAGRPWPDGAVRVTGARPPWPPRPATLPRHATRRVRRDLLDRLRRRKSERGPAKVSARAGDVETRVSEQGGRVVKQRRPLAWQAGLSRYAPKASFLGRGRRTRQRVTTRRAGPVGAGRGSPRCSGRRRGGACPIGAGR